MGRIESKIMNNQTIFVDLEQTLIESWYDHRICNREKVSNFIKAHGNEVELFSFAVWDEKDREKFEIDLRQWIEEEHNLVFTKIHCLEDIAKVIREFRGVQYETLNDVITLHGKDRALEDFCLAQNKTDWKFVLLDDVVQNKTIIFRDLNVEFNFVRC